MHFETIMGCIEPAFKNQVEDTCAGKLSLAAFSGSKAQLCASFVQILIAYVQRTIPSHVSGNEQFLVSLI